MLFKPSKPFARRARLTAWTIGLAICVTFSAAKPSFAVDCANDPDKAWLITVNDPPPADESAIKKLIARYNWALDDHRALQLEGLFADDVFYELCNAAGEQLVQKSNSEDLKVYHDGYFSGFVDRGTQARHIESNTLLNLVDANTIQGKTTVVVTLQHPDIETPVLDYTGSMRTEFKKVGNLWQFSKITLITDGPRLELRAR